MSGNDSQFPDDDLAREVRNFELCRQFEDDWNAGRPLSIEQALLRLPEPERPLALERLIALEYELRGKAAERPDPAEYLRRFHNQQDVVLRALADLTNDRLPTCGDNPDPGSVRQQDPPASEPPDVNPMDLPLRIGRYEFVRKLGQGGFGIVGQYFDTAVERNVAIKVPRNRSAEDLKKFFREAAHQAASEAQGTVTIYDVHPDGDPPCIVMEFMAGGDLTALTQNERISWDRLAELLAKLADALDGLHKRGYIHRDLKPANVLLSGDGHPKIADCGLVMHVGIRQQIRGEFAGSTAYMSPEQLRCEDIDARSDLWSLGVILYQLLTHQHPFHQLPGTLRNSVLSVAPTEPRGINSTIPPELQRICLRLLEKRPDDRYQTAGRLARELRTWRDAQFTPVAEQPAWTSLRPTLQTFQAKQAELYLDLLPGPRERDGTPVSIHFWKTRIESLDPQAAFKVGVLYGKSGSGKSSLLRAGLLPRLADHVTVRLVEATPEDTEVRLLKSLREVFSALTEDLNLVESLALIREELLPQGGKLLIVIDQFEQWLHTWNGRPEDQLPAALRQCDGGRLQCLLTIRDDFWLSVTRLMREVGVRLREHGNTMAVDLFDPSHATKILTRYGQAMGEVSAEPTEPQRTFVDQAVRQLGQENGRIVCVRLVMLAQMMAGRPWTPETLEGLGGLDELGVRFLDEVISGDSAPPHRRRYGQAMDCILDELVPSAGVDIKERMHSKQHLLASCPKAYQRDPAQFDEVLEILVQELRLITPTEPDTASAGDASDGDAATAASADQRGTSEHESAKPASERYYQLTHDYLVAPLRERRVRNDRKTLRGRARIRLRELAGMWHSRQSSQFLPRWWEDGFLRLCTRPRQWNPAERRMMRASAWHHGTRALLLTVVLLAVGGIGVAAIQHSRYEHQRELAERQLFNVFMAKLSEVEGATDELRPLIGFVEDELREQAGERKRDWYRNALLASLIVLPDPGPWEDGRVRDLLLDSTLPELELIAELLLSRAGERLAEMVPDLRSETLAKEGDPARDIRIASLLAQTGEADESYWAANASRIARDAVTAVERNPSDLATLVRMLEPQSTFLGPALADIAAAPEAGESANDKALDLLRGLAKDDLKLLVETALRLPPARVSSTLAIDFEGENLRDQRSDIVKQLEAALPPDGSEPSDDPEEKRSLNRRRATAAALLLRLERPNRTWPLLRHGDDPSLRTLIVHFANQLEVSPRLLLAGLKEQQGDDVRSAILQILGDFEPAGVGRGESPPPPWSEIVEVAQQIEEDPNMPSSMRSSAEWLLGRWGKTALTSQEVDEKQIVAHLPTEHLKRFDGPDGHKLVVLHIPTFEMGSPKSAVPRDDDEKPHARQVNRRIAFTTKEVTVDQYANFLGERFGPNVATSFRRACRQASPRDDCPATGTRWNYAALYCNALSVRLGLREYYEVVDTDPQRSAFLLKASEGHFMTFRLPTEAEWEFAARAMAKTSYHFGDDPDMLKHYACYLHNSDEQTSPVGLRKPNHFGLFDMHGNAAEWCHEPYAAYPVAKGQTLVVDTMDTDISVSSDHRVLRGGAFSLYARHARSANRDMAKPSDSPEPVGFRVVLVLPAGPSN